MACPRDLGMRNHREDDVMAIVQFTRFKSDKPEEMVKTATQAKAIFEKHGAEFLRLSRFHAGSFGAEWLISPRNMSWEVDGKGQEEVAKDEAFAKLYEQNVTLAELTS